MHSQPHFKDFVIKLVNYEDHTGMHGQQNIKTLPKYSFIDERDHTSLLVIKSQFWKPSIERLTSTDW